MHQDTPLFHDSAPDNPAQVYDLWLAHNNECATYGRESIDAKRSTSYRMIWQGWLKYLASLNEGKGCAWSSVDAVDVSNFLKSGLRRSKNLIPTNTAQRRYWRVLSRIYTFAHSKGWTAENPVLALATADVPAIEKPKGAILTLGQYKACFDCLPPLYGTATQARDHTMALLLLTTGITPQEVRTLCVQDLERDMATGKVTHVAITAQRSDTQRRRIAVDERLANALLFWLTQRHMFNSLQRVRPSKEEAPTTAGDRHPFTRLFVSQKSPEVTMGTLLHVCKQLILEACKKDHSDAPPRIGPQVIRNTVLTKWLNEGIGIHQVTLMAGLKNPKGLLHLGDHLNPEVRQHLAKSNFKDDEAPPILQPLAA
ncbi:site-specific integrase [Diaphorobacter sp. LR2014-1]|uniref:tyrosine-type recombinase/integrase n=1 Tax=Diaphorobacter sp. LR2014-1 TaxID=1933219 RepID=UPI000CDACFA0|nr:site-specific integrase [Diaphorobacter sp. LR2014-1]